MTNSLIKYNTTFESTNNLPMQIVLGHGENADLVANFTDNGIPVSLSGYTARALFQPKSQWGTDNWYECPCEISGDTATAHWGDAYDNGDNAVKLFMHLSKDGKVAYPAIYNIGLFATPGYTPGSIEPVQKTLDFSEYELVNAPWVETSDYSSDLSSIRSDISGLDGVAVKSIEYTGSNKIQVKQFLQANPNAVVIWKADGLGTMTQNIFSKTGDDGEYWTYSCFDASTNQWAWFKLYADWEISLDFILHKSDVPTTGDSTLSATYSETPRFSEWAPVNYTFTVEWRNNLSSWVFMFDETLINDDTTEWKDPLATHLSVSYDGILLEANRTRLDVGYVLGSQTDKPVQPMGNYVTIDDLSAVNYLKIRTEQNGINLQDDIKVYWYAFETAQSTSYTIPNPNLSQIQSGFQYFDYELEVNVPSNATSISGPSDWGWVTGYELPTSDFAGKTIYIKCRLMCFDKPETIAQVWRIA